MPEGISYNIIEGEVTERKISPYTTKRGEIIRFDRIRCYFKMCKECHRRYKKDKDIFLIDEGYSGRIKNNIGDSTRSLRLARLH